MNIDDRILELKFSCDLSVCKGACCTVEGTLGAPLKREELPLIEMNIETAKKYLTSENKDVIEKEGYYVEYDGKLWMNNVNDNDCVFSYYEGDIAKCSFQKAYNNGEISFKKPISCELFPIRVYGENGNDLRYEKSYFCEEALEAGKVKNTTIFEFVKDALIRAFGVEFYNENIKKIK